jgi:hypothetical protein
MQGSSLLERVMEIGNSLFAQNAAMGSCRRSTPRWRPACAAASTTGPDGIGELWGHPRKVTSNASSQDVDAARRLWTLSEQLTGVTYPLGTAG